MTDPSPPTPPDQTPPPARRTRATLTALDERISGWVGVALPHPRWFTAPFGWLSITGNYGVIWYVVAAVGGWVSADGAAELALRRFAYVSGAVLACQGITFFVKLGVGRRRPVEKDPSGGEHIRKPRSPSFPSSHASMSAVGAIALADLYPSWVALFVVLALVLSISRVYLRVHYVFDVLAGLVLGTVLGFAFILVAPAP